LLARDLVLESPFTSTVEVAKSLNWRLPVNLLMKDRFDSIKAIGKIKEVWQKEQAFMAKFAPPSSK